MDTATNGTSLADLVREVVDDLSRERGPLLEVLHAVQERLGHVPAAAVPLVAEALNLSRADVHGVVTFYRDFTAEPLGTSVVRVCRAEACAAVGAADLVSALEKDLGLRAGETTSDGSVSLGEVFCLGNCALGPAVEVDGRLHGRVDRERVLSLVGRSRGV